LEALRKEHKGYMEFHAEHIPDNECAWLCEIGFNGQSYAFGEILRLFD
jgi:hypothetical protein